MQSSPRLINYLVISNCYYPDSHETRLNIGAPVETSEPVLVSGFINGRLFSKPDLAFTQTCKNFKRSVCFLLADNHRSRSDSPLFLNDS